MTNYYSQLSKEQKKEILKSLEEKMKEIKKQIDWYKKTMKELDLDCWQVSTCASMINYWTKELSSVLDTINKMTSED